jgi:hypothetical protein
MSASVQPPIGLKTAPSPILRFRILAAFEVTT